MGESKKDLTGKIIEMSIALIIFASLIGAVQTAIGDANVTGIAGTIVNTLLLLMFAVGVVLAVYYTLVKR